MDILSGSKKKGGIRMYKDLEAKRETGSWNMRRSE